MRILALFVLCCVCAASAFAVQEPPPFQTWLPSAASALETGSTFRTGHGWFVATIQTRTAPRTGMGAPPPSAAVVAKQGRPEIVLLHIPPLEQGEFDPAPPLKRVADLTEMPEALAATDNMVWAVFPSELAFDLSDPADSPARQRRVLRWRAEPNIAGSWDYLPVAKAETQPALPGTGTLLDAAGTSRGPVALLRDDTLRLWLLDGPAWREVALPSAIHQRNAEPLPDSVPRFTNATLCSDGAGIALLTRSGSSGPAILWTGRPLPPAGPVSERGPSAFDWDDGVEISSDALAGVTHPLGTSIGRLVAPDRRVTLAAFDDRGGASVISLGHAGEPIWSGRLSRPVALLARDGIDRLLIVSERDALPTDATPSPKSSPFRILDLSTSGDVVYDGPPKSTAVVTSVEFRIVAFALAALMVVVLVFVLRPSSKDPAPVPPGMAPASPGKRLLAAAIDLVLPALVGFSLFGLRVSDFVGMDLITRFDVAWRPILLTMAVGAIFGAINESMTGRTLGKRFLGIGVLAVRRIEEPGGERDPSADGPADAAVAHAESVSRGDQTTDDRPFFLGKFEAGLPSIRASLLRNGVKWFFPPLFVLAFLDAALRSPADALGKTMVVEPIETENDGAADGD